MTPDEIVAITILAAIFGSLLLYGVQKVGFSFVKLFSTKPKTRPTVMSKPNAVAPQENSNFPPSRVEAEAEAPPEAAPEAPVEADIAIVQLTEKALQEREAACYERGMIDAYTTLLKGGHINGKRAEMQRALASVAGARSKLLPGLSGRANQRLAQAMSEVPLPEEPQEAETTTPLAGRPLPAGIKFREEEA